MNASSPSGASLVNLPGAVFTHHIAHYLDITALLMLRSVSQYTATLSHSRSSWSHTALTPRSLQHLLYLTSSTSSSLPSLPIAMLDLSQCGPLMNDNHLDLTMRCFPYLTHITLNTCHRLSIHALTLLSLHLSAGNGCESEVSSLQSLVYRSIPFKLDCATLPVHHRGLTVLDLSHTTNIDIDTFHSLNELQQLKSLNLSRNPKLRDHCFSFLRDNTQYYHKGYLRREATLSPRATVYWPVMESLKVSGCSRLSNKSLKYFALLPKLRSLDVSQNSNISTRGLHYLTGERSLCRESLSSISLANCVKLNNFSIDLLSSQSLPSLTALDVGELPITAAVLESVSPLLRNLVLDGCDQVCEGGVRTVLSSMADLQSLSLSYNYHITDQSMIDAVPGLSSAGQLTALKVCYTSITSWNFLRQSFYRSLIQLDLSGNKLAFINIDTDSDSGDGNGVCLPSLQSVALRSCAFIPLAFLSFLSLNGLSLIQFDFAHSHAVNARLLTTVSMLFPRLVSLTLDGCAGVNDEALLVLASYPCLSSLSLHDCRHVTPQGVKYLHQSDISNATHTDTVKQKSLKSFLSSLFSSKENSQPSSLSSSPSLLSGNEPSSPTISSLTSHFTLPSLPSSLSFGSHSFSLPSSISSHLPQIELPHVTLPSLSLASLQSHLRPSSLSLSSIQNHLRPSSTLSFPSAFSAFSGPFSSAFTTLHDEPASPFTPPPINGNGSGDSEHESQSLASTAQNDTPPSNNLANENEPDEIAPPSPPLAAVNELSDDDSDSDSNKHNASLSLSRRLSLPLSPSTIPTTPFPSLTWLHLCHVHGGKEDKVASLIRRAHPFIVVEGEAERKNEEDREREEKQMRENREEQQLSESDGDSDTDSESDVDADATNDVSVNDGDSDDSLVTDRSSMLSISRVYSARFSVSLDDEGSLSLDEDWRDDSEILPNEPLTGIRSTAIHERMTTAQAQIQAQGLDSL